MAQEFTRENVTAALKDIVAEYGEDYRYPPSLVHETCTYSEAAPGGIVPSCIVGQVVARLAPEYFDAISDLEARTNFTNSTTAYNLLRGDLSAFAYLGKPVPKLPTLTEDRDLIVAISAAQNTQDSKGSWGTALEAFEDYLATH